MWNRLGARQIRSFNCRAAKISLRLECCQQEGFSAPLSLDRALITHLFLKLSIKPWRTWLCDQGCNLGCVTNSTFQLGEANKDWRLNSMLSKENVRQKKNKKWNFEKKWRTGEGGTVSTFSFLLTEVKLLPKTFTRNQEKFYPHIQEFWL